MRSHRTGREERSAEGLPKSDTKENEAMGTLPDTIPAGQDGTPSSAPFAIQGQTDELMAALEAFLLYADPSGEGLYDGASDIAGVKQNGALVLKGSFITTCIRARALMDRLPENPSSSIREAETWRDIGDAPKDGTVVDLWKTTPDGHHGRRIPDCRWDTNRSFDGGIGRVALPDAWVHSHGGEVHLDGGALTHWRPVPDAPLPASSDEGAA
jgi:hypothetical protein